MAINEDLFEFDEERTNNPTDIRVVGVGGGGNNAVTRMKEAGVRGVKFIAVNTDAQDLKQTKADVKLRISDDNSDGLGAGADPRVGLNSAMKCSSDVKQAIEGADLLFVTAGMGGGTGTGAAPVIANLAKDELGILTIGVVTRPFEYEGHVRQKNAEAGIKQLRENVDTLIVVPNEKLFDVIDEDTPFLQAFEMADEVLYQGVEGISELIVQDGKVNLDFADVQTVMKEKGDALMGIGEATGENAAVKAAQEALHCPLLETNEIDGASGVIVNIMGGPNLKAVEVREAINLVRKKAAPEANVIAGNAVREDVDAVRVTVIATGFPSADKQSRKLRGSGNKIYRVDDYTDKDLSTPAWQRKRQVEKNVEVVNEDPDHPSEGYDEDDLNIPTFMRVK